MPMVNFLKRLPALHRGLERFKKPEEEESWLQDEIDYLAEQIEQPEFRYQVTAVLVAMTTLLAYRLYSPGRVKTLSGDHVLNMSALNDANLFKEVFLAYLQAAMLEPVLSIAGMEHAQGAAVIINLLTLGSICWWIWLISDAFSFEDVMSSYKYHIELREEMEEDPIRFSWLRLKEFSSDAEMERQSLLGSIRKDIALWFMLACIGAAWLPGAVTHRDVLHAYVVTLLWGIMHYSCRRATSWSSGYFISFLFPSTALMPLEYCLPLMDVADTVEDLEFVESYREFVTQRTGVELIIEC